jgi:predicted small metal-binding protein
MDGEASGRGTELACDCGYMAHGADEDELVAAAQTHAWDAHGMKLSAELILAMAGANGAAVHTATAERKADPGVWPSTARRVQ